MNWLIFFLVYLINIRSEGNLFEVQRVFFLENNFWCADQNQVKRDKGYLYKVNFDLENTNEYVTGFHYYSETCYSLLSTNLKYLVIKSSMTKGISSFFKSPESNGFLLIFRFFFIDKPIISNCPHCFKGYKGKRRDYTTYKLPEKISENIILLKNNMSTNTRMEHIQERFKGFLSVKMLNFNEYIENVSEEELNKKKDTVNFNLYYFESYFVCFENLRKFINNLCYFKLVNDNVSDNSTVFSEMFVDIKTTMKVSQFKESLCKKIDENLQKLNDNEIGKTWKPLFYRCCDYLLNEILNNKIFFPISDKYDFDYYFEQLYNIIYESVKQRQKKSSTIVPSLNSFTWYKITCLLKFCSKKLKSNVVKELCESEYVLKLFSELLDSEVETLDKYINVEKMVCDYYNMFIFIINLYNESNKCSSAPYSYFPPIFIDNYSLRIIDGIEISFNLTAKLGYVIKGFDDKEKDIIIIKDIDYFINEFNMLYCPSEVLKMKNIHGIEIISLDDKKNSKKFKISEYLNV